MRVTKVFICAMLILLLVMPSGARGQKRVQRRSSSSAVLVNLDKPGVFVSFLKPIEVEPLETGVDHHYLLFQITNNTKWLIWLDMHDVPKEYGDAKLLYSIEDKDNRIQVDARCHVCSINPLGAGRSLTFSIPADHAREGTHFRIGYSFEWERKTEAIEGSDSTHSVEFYFDQLPKAVRTLFEAER